MQEYSVQIDAFNTNLHGSKILCQGPFQNKYAPILEFIEKLRDPFRRKILVTKTPFSFSKYITLQYDAIFQIKEVNDWSLVLTYAMHAPKPALIVIEDVNIPDIVWQKIPKQITTIHISSTPIQNLRPYDAIFFAPIEELSSSFTDVTFKQLQIIYKQNYSQKEYRELIQELCVANAGIAWMRHGEQVMNGNLFWYDPVENQGESLSNKQMSELFSWLSRQFIK
jgi:hypothetical protein